MPGNTGLVTLYSEVVTKQVEWLWYPYIAYGKITLLQGDPGDGKSTMMLHLISEISNGGRLPDGTAIVRPQRVIYQCSEDGAGDTIKPRLVRMGANCKNVAFINEERCGGLTLDDERIREAMTEFSPKLLVIDPVQAYTGNHSVLQMAGKARKLMRRLGMWAEAFNCAIVLIGHMNKRESAKGLYRGLGSIDIVAAARSVLQVERDQADPQIRIVSHIKNSLDAAGRDIRFEIRSETGFQWLDVPNAGKRHICDDSATVDYEDATKQGEAVHILVEALKEQDVASSDLFDIFSEKKISVKTARIVQKRLGIRAYRKQGRWYWTMKKKGEDTS